ncbi:hypothetical protein BH09SUM1_BH09SUM1_20940 [soil metagenome]
MIKGKRPATTINAPSCIRLLCAMGLSMLPVVTLAGEKEEKGSQSFISITPLYVDSESRVLASMEICRRPTAFMEFYNENGLLLRNQAMGHLLIPEDYPDGTFYVYRMGMDLMDGETMGYNQMGNGSFFLPTILIPASQTPELGWIDTGSTDFNDFSAAILHFIIDSNDQPSIALSNGLTGGIFSYYDYKLQISFLEGNSRAGSQSYTFLHGAARNFAAAVWGDPYQTSAGEVILDANIPVGPLQITYGPDAYTTATLTYVSGPHQYDARSVVFESVSGYSATQYLDAIGFTPSPPPSWIVRMAIQQKLSGKTKWLYWPLDRYVDVNGDGVLDAADLIALDQGKEFNVEGARSR